MLTVEQIKEGLKDRRLQVVADATGLAYMTLKRVRDGEGMPSYKTVSTLSDYLTASGVKHKRK